jgi:hypothetical protein
MREATGLREFTDACGQSCGVPARRFPDRVRLPLRFDPERLRSDLERLRELSWTRHFVPQNYSGDWSVIALRAKAGAVHPVQMIYSDPTARVFEDAPALGRTPYFCEVLSQFACPLRSVRLMRLTPGSGIKTHQDHDLDVESGAVRFHIPIVTNAAVEFLLNGAPVALAAGETWYLRLSDPHSVVNRGTTDRIHLVIDAEANAWVRESLSRGDAG